MCGKATLAMEVSSTSMKVASVTATAIIQGLIAGRQASALSRVPAAALISLPSSALSLANPDLGDDRHTGAQLAIIVLSRIEHDFDWNALHNLHVVSGRILRR